MLDGDKAGQESMPQIKGEMTKANLNFLGLILYLFDISFYQVNYKELTQNPARVQRFNYF